jgi:hypothetical protein
MNKDKALDLALKELLFYRDFANCPDWRDESQVAITAIKEVLEQPTPVCPKGLFEFECWIEDVCLTCFLEYSPEEKGSVDSHGSPYEPDFENVYKVGISSDGRIMQRMYDNMRKSGFDFKVIRFTKIKAEAGKVEKELLAIGTKIDQQTKERLGRFDGHTEYVFMAEEQIAKCHKTLDQYAI